MQESIVGLATMAFTIQPIYEGLAKHSWSDAQLVGLENALAAKDFLADYEKAIRGERAYAIGSLEDMRLTREYKTFEEVSGTNKLVTVSLRWPNAFFYQNELALAQLYEQYALPLIDLERRIASPTGTRKADAAVNNEMSHINPYNNLALMTFAALSKSMLKFAVIQADTDLAQVACALERYRLDHGEYPETLAVLAPSYIGKLPHDVINGQPLHYRRMENKQFILYSIGLDEKDDGGQIFLTKAGRFDRDKGDIVWRYP